MESRFVLPVIVSTAFHACVFLFGSGSHSPAMMTPVPDHPVKTESWRPQMDFEEVVVQPPSSDRTAMRPLIGYEDFRPDLPEPAHTISDFVEPPAPLRPAAPDPIAALPAGMPGDPNGIENGVGPITVNLGALDNPPRIRVQVSPAYPSDARGSGLAGEVLVEFLVDQQGQVQDPHVIKASDPRFEAPTLRAVGRWRFEPGTNQGRPVRFRMSVPVVFHLDA